MLGAGGVVAGANPALTVPELQHHLSVTATKFVVVQESFAKNVVAAAEVIGITESSIFAFHDDIVGHDVLEVGITSSPTDSKTTSFNVLLKCGQQSWHSHDNTSLPALHATTSGTTGVPKAAVLPHRYVVSQGLILEDLYRNKADEVSSSNILLEAY